MQGIWNYIPEKNHVSAVYSIAAALYLGSVLHVMLFRKLDIKYPNVGNLRSTCAMPSMLVCL
jgi:hypothetical protein